MAGQQCSTCGCSCGGKATACSISGCTCGGKLEIACPTCGSTYIRKLMTSEDTSRGAHGKDDGESAFSGKDANYENFRGYGYIDDYEDIVDNLNETTFDYGDEVTQDEIDLEAVSDVFASLGMPRQEFKKIVSDNKKKEERQNKSDEEKNDDDDDDDEEEEEE